MVRSSLGDDPEAAELDEEADWNELARMCLDKHRDAYLKATQVPPRTHPPPPTRTLKQTRGA